MSGPSCVMEWCSPPRLKPMLLTAFLLTSTNIVCLHGGPVPGVDMHCVNNLFTINCSLSIAPSKRISDGTSSYWLEVTDLETTVCALTNTDGDYFCSIDASDITHDKDLNTFMDMVILSISLCHNKNNETCEELEEDYVPVENIKPNPPCCLAVNHNSSHHHFTWKSTYEEYRSQSGLVDSLEYQLHYYKRGDRHNVTKIKTDSLNFLVDDKQFVPDTEYVATVRSSPNGVIYKGQWSDWSTEAHWKTEGVHSHSDPPLNVGKVFIPLCVLVPLVFLLCYAPVKKWRQSAFIPTPAPYFNTLYSDCQGDFKSWVVTQENTANMLKAEETLQIDTLTKCVDIQEEEECQPQCHHHFMEGSTYSNITDPGCDTSLLGVPYAVSTMAPPSPPGSSLISLTLSSQPGSPTEGDSGCWIWNHTSLERDPPFYCNEYCTLSTFQQTGPVTAEYQCGTPTKSCLTEMVGVESVIEA